MKDYEVSLVCRLGNLVFKLRETFTISGTIRKIWLENGAKGFYRGLGPTIFGYLPTWAIYFTVYDNCKRILAETLNPNGEEDFFNHILSAMTAGMASTCATSPVWVVKTRFMVSAMKVLNAG